jgi:methylenetetrahydrofolate dehydrogenase (NADP+) / methenyltetrahydrofolate cyclohydrolase
MGAQILDGKLVSEAQKEKVREMVAGYSRPIKLVTVLVGDDPASQIYVSSKHKACEKVGIESENQKYPSSMSQQELDALIDTLNEDDTVDGILVQLPLPEHLDEQGVTERIRPDKDVDCFHPKNFGLLLQNNQIIAPCTPAGIIEILKYYKIPLSGKHAVIVGRSNIVGKPLIPLLLGENCTVTTCHSKSQPLEDYTNMADILIAAIGKPEIIKESMVKPGAIVVDVGINRVEDASRDRGYRVVGDVAYDAVSNRAASITPVPGGVGPMTIAMLLTNCYYLAKFRDSSK